jgi:hypothetical protein
MTNSQIGKRLFLRGVAGLGVVLGALGVAACDAGGEAGAQTETESPIVGGNAAGGVGVVHITTWNGVLGTDATWCTGTVIANNRILTAAHCFDYWLSLREHNDTTYLTEGDGLFVKVDYTDDGVNWTCLTHPTDSICKGTIDRFASVHVSRVGPSTDIALLRFSSPLQRIKRASFRQISTADVRVRQAVEEWGSGYIDTAGTNGGDKSLAMRRAVVRITEVKPTTFKTANTSSQTCDGDSGGPTFAGPSDLLVGILKGTSADTGRCGSVGSTSTWHRITPTIVNFINNHVKGLDTPCRETIAGTGFYACS